jgi:hypothetical protein
MKFLLTSVNLKNCSPLSFGWFFFLLCKQLFQSNLTFLFCYFNLGVSAVHQRALRDFHVCPKKMDFVSLPQIFSSLSDSPGPISMSQAKYCIYRSFATRVWQLKIWHFWVPGIERNVCRCSFNRYSVITQFAKLAAGEQLCRRCTHRKL